MPSHLASQKRKNISAKHAHSRHTGLATMAIFPGRQGPLVDGAPVPPAAEFHDQILGRLHLRSRADEIMWSFVRDRQQEAGHD